MGTDVKCSGTFRINPRRMKLIDVWKEGGEDPATKNGGTSPMHSQKRGANQGVQGKCPNGKNKREESKVPGRL